MLQALRSVLTLIALVALATACGGGDDDSPAFADARPGPDAPPDAQPPDAEPPDALPPDAPPPPDAMVSPSGPVITITEPTASTEVSSDRIVTTTALTARCKAEPNGDTQVPVDSSSVTMDAVVGATSQTVTAVPEGNGIFAATFDLSAFPNGTLEIRCTASDLAATPETNSGGINTYLDLGPRITIVRPAAGASKGTPVEIFFEVVPWPVTGDLVTDPGAALGTPVELLVAGVPQVLTNPAPGFYLATLNFDDFTPSLDGVVRYEVRAPNTRQNAAGGADPTTRTTKATFLADNAGPTITITSPSASALVSGLVTVTAEVTDAADVARVTGTLGHGTDSELTFELVRDGTSDKFEGIVDSRQLSNESFVFPLLEVRAEDSVGNESAAGHVVSLDNRRPIVSLDSPSVREALLAEDNSTIIGCSKLFDPLGDDAVSFGDTVGALSEFRVRAEDRGNGPEPGPDGIYIPQATVDPTSVELFVLDRHDDLTTPILVDLDGGGTGTCDDINPALSPAVVPNAANEAAVVSLAAIEPAGASEFGPPVIPYGTNSADFDNVCNTVNTEQGEKPAPLCGLTSPLTRTMQSEVGGDAVIFGIQPVGGVACLGNAFDAPATNISDGWACVVARAVDKLGNVGVSMPMPVCFETGGADDCSGAPPTTLCPITCTVPTFADFPTRQLRKLVVQGPECSDGIDNDGDGAVDLDDADCNNDPLGESEDGGA